MFSITDIADIVQTERSKPTKDNEHSAAADLGNSYAPVNVSKASEIFSAKWLHDELKLKALLDSRVDTICDLDDLSSSAKADFIKRAFRAAGRASDDTTINQLIIEKYNAQRGGEGMQTIKGEEAKEFFQDNDAFIIENILFANELNIIAGLSGVGKTLFIFMLFQCLLSSKDEKFLGLPVHRHLVDRVIYIGLDAGNNVYGKLLEKSGLYSVLDGSLPKGFEFVPQSSNWSITDHNLSRLEEKLKEGGKPIIVIDSLLAATSKVGIDENSPRMAQALLDVKILCERYEATLVVLAHQKKDTTQDNIGSDSLRGHSSIPAFCGQITTINLLDMPNKVNGKLIGDRKSNRRRLTAHHRGVPVDLLIEFDFQHGTVKSLGDFYDNLYKVHDNPEGSYQIEQAASPFQTVMNTITSNQRAVFCSLLRSGSEACTAKTLADDTSISERTVRSILKQLIEIDSKAGKLVTEVESPTTSKGRQSNHYRAEPWALIAFSSEDF